MIDSLEAWHAPSWQRFCTQRERLPHAILLAGSAGLGKRILLKAMLASLFCHAPKPADAHACGRCRGCTVHAAGNHPDLHLLKPELDRVSIGVDQVRAFCERLSMTPQANAWQIGVLDPAEAMTVQAANALLKTLEEPSANTLLFLACDQPGKLLPTLLSRTQRWPLKAPSAEDTVIWLTARNPSASAADVQLAVALAAGAPLLAQRLLQNGGVSGYRGLEDELAELSRAPGGELAFAKRWVGKLPEFVQGYEQILLNRMKLLASSLTGRSEILSLARRHEQLLKLRDWQGSGVRLDLALSALLSEPLRSGGCCV